MDSTTILVKTSKAVNELAQRTGALPQKLRPVLILVDGKKVLSELRRQYSDIPDFEEHLAWMVANGFIQPLSARNAQPTVLKSTAGSISGALIELAHELLGDQGAIVVQRLQESEKSVEALKQTLERCCKLVRLTIDEGKASQFLESGNKLLASTEYIEA